MAEIAKFFEDEEEKMEDTRSGPPRIREDVVGLEEEVKLLLNIVTFQRQRYFSYLCILGMGGVGKTTLASLLYNHTDVASQFEIRAWVNVSAASTAKDIFSEIIRQLQKGDELEMLMMRADEHGLLRILLLCLTGRSYFIVLDDISTREQLLPILRGLPRQDKNNMLVITSRKNDGVMLGRGYVHEMKTLDRSKSWELFLTKVFTNHRRCPKHLERIGRQIVRKCDGLPLAIQEAGAKLAKMIKSETVWEEFLETMELSETLASLDSSYDSLSKRLKSCFSSLGFFKEGAIIRVDKLIQIWVAGGTVSLIDEDDDEDESEYGDDDDEYGRWDVDVLIEQYFVEVKDLTKDLTVKNCEINYNLHRLAVKKGKEKQMFEVITKEGSDHQSSHTPLHRAICCSREKLSYSTNQDKHLVSLFFRGGGNFDATLSYWKSFESLKILDFEDFGLKILPEIVGTLVTLKYLGLRNNFITELPCSLGQLVNLEVLDIALNFMVEVPNIIWKMESLRHLYMSGIICREPLNIDTLYNLETLTYISADKWTYEVSGLKMMTNLRKLGIEAVDGNSDVSKLFASLADLHKLEHLILKGFRFRSMPELHELHILRGLKHLKLDGLLTRLPSADNFPPNIENLILSNSCLEDDPMPVLEKISSLYYLKLRNAFIGEKMVISCDEFASLQILCIEEMWHLRSVEVEEDSRVELTQFEIKSCPYLKTLPEKFRSKMVTNKDFGSMTQNSTGGATASVSSSSTTVGGSSGGTAPVFDFSSVDLGVKYVGSLLNLGGDNSINSNNAPTSSIFGSSSATGASTAASVFSSSFDSSFAASSPLNNYQMTLESTNSLVSGSIGGSSSSSIFGSSLAAGFSFGASPTSLAPINSTQPNSFQFGGVEFNAGGSFSLGSDGGDKQVKLNRNKNRKK